MERNTPFQNSSKKVNIFFLCCPSQPHTLTRRQIVSQSGGIFLFPESFSKFEKKKKAKLLRPFNVEERQKMQGEFNMLTHGQIALKGYTWKSCLQETDRTSCQFWDIVIIEKSSQCLLFHIQFVVINSSKEHD